MRKGKNKVYRILTAISLLCVLIFAAGVLIYGIKTGFGLPDLLPAADSAVPEQEYHYEETPKSLREIRIDWVDGPVTVLFHEKDTIEVMERTGKALREDEKLLMELSGGELSIHWNSSLLNIGLFRDTAKTLEVRLPAKFEHKLEKVRIYTVSGDVTLDTLHAQEIDVETVSGALSLRNTEAESFRAGSTSGKILCENVTGTENFRIHSVSGALDLIGIKAGEAKLDTTSGEIRLIGEAAAFECVTVSGNAECTLVQWPEKLTAESVTGDLTLQLPESGTGFLASVKTVSGVFSCDFETQKKNKLYLCGEGKAEVKLSTTSGNAALVRIAE